MNLFTSLRTLALALILSVGIGYAYAAWAPPTASPTNGNTDAPVNVGNAAQVKGGGLGVSGLLTAFTGIKIGTSAADCSSPSDVGVIKNTGTDLEGCVDNGGTFEWKSLTAIGGGGGGGGGPTSPPTVTLSQSDADGRIPIDYSVTLTWTTSPDATACAVETSSSPGWSGGKPLNGSEAITPTNSGNNTYTLTCSNAAGSTSKSVVIDVRPWTNVSGSGSLGQSCDGWLAGSNQAGIDGSPPRAIVQWSGYTAPSSCVYMHPGNEEPDNCNPSPIAGSNSVGSQWPVDTCAGAYTQTRR